MRNYTKYLPFHNSVSVLWEEEDFWLVLSLMSALFVSGRHYCKIGTPVAFEDTFPLPFQ